MQWRVAADLLNFRTIPLLIVPIAFAQVPLTTAQIAKKVSPSVVVIRGKTDAGDVLGSGFIVSKDGRIVTNLHVIRDMKTATVQLANGEIFDSLSVLASDARRDLAVIHIAGFDLPPLDLGNSNSVTVGEPVVIVGSPRGLEGTVTAGILSSVRDGGNGFKVLQTDAAVNPGNSGGPLVNREGQAIGVVSFKLRSSEGLNFAVPINFAPGLLNELHEPMSLEQMRRNLLVKSAMKGPSLNETLDWLKEKIRLAACHHVIGVTDDSLVPKFGKTEDYSFRTIPIKFESCTVVIESHRDHPLGEVSNRP
jgi:S1-C subfamily serine protease